MDINKKVKVVQQVLAPCSKGGVSSEFRALENSSLCERYEFVPLILDEGRRGINIHDILFYYRGIKREKPDIVHVRGASVDGLNAEIAARLVGHVKVLVCVHGMYSDFVYYNPIKKWIAKHVVEPMCFGLAHGISCVYKSCETRDNFLKYKKKMVPFVYNRMPKFSKKPYIRERFRSQLDIKDDAVVGVFCGRVSKEKGLEFLVKALVSIIDRINADMHFLIVGQGDYLNEFKTAIEINSELSKCVHFLGIKDDVEPILSAADYFILPSLHENHSIALLEAMALELPAIATDVGGNRETLKDGRFGILIPPNDDVALARAMLEMEKDNVRNSFKERIKAYEFYEFSDDAVDAQLDAVYQKLVL